MLVDWTLALGALVVGVVVGLTGMGGGALMTPMLVLFFGVSPLAAVSSDLVASTVMKPVGSAVHLRNGTVRTDLVRWLCVGSVPAAFAGVLVARSLGRGAAVDDLIQKALGVSLIIIALMGLYPKLRASELVGTDLVQAVPLVASAAVGHLTFGDFRLGVTSALLVGSIPGAYIGAQLSTRLPGALIRRALAFVLLASALKLLGVSTVLTAVLLIGAAVLAGPAWMLLRRRHGFPALPRDETPVLAAVAD